MKTLTQDWLDQQSEIMCPMCDTNDLELMGTLGKKVYCMCRACGWKFSPREVA